MLVPARSSPENKALLASSLLPTLPRAGSRARPIQAIGAPVRLRNGCPSVQFASLRLRKTPEIVT